jgi:hypothetical protein
MLLTAVAFLFARNAQLTGESLNQEETSSSLEVSRDVSDTVYPGSTFQVVLSIEAERPVSNLTVIEETGNLTVISSPSGSVHNRSVSWYFGSLGGNHTVKYTAALDADRFSNFNISGGYENGEIEGRISGDTEVNISS